MSDQQKSLKQIMDFRLEKLDQLINNGINPYPVKFNSTHSSHEIIENFLEYEGKIVVVAGRIMVIRKMGKASFFQVMDSSGKIQILFMTQYGFLMECLKSLYKELNTEKVLKIL